MQDIWNWFIKIIRNPEQHTAIFGLFVAVLISIVGFLYKGVVWLYRHYIAENSARKTGLESFGNRSDLHFSRSGALIGRNEEIKQLKDFCRKTPRKWYRKQPFLFWIVSGEGGSGKSKLCYEFLFKMKRRGWTVCQPQKNRDALSEASEHLPNKTLFMLDYAEYDTKEITEWLVLLGRDHRGCKKKRRIGRRVRVLLIQRRPNEGGSFSDARLVPFRHKDPLAMEQMGEKYLKHLIRYSAKHYIKIKKKEKLSSLHKLRKEDIDLVYKTLVTSVDPPKDKKRKGHAPLYAIILAQATVDGVKIEKEEDALNYVVDHEKQRYKNLLMKLCKHPNGTSCNGVEYNEQLFRAIMTLLTIATMTRRWELTTENILKISPPLYRNDIEQFVELYSPPIDKNALDYEIELFDWSVKTRCIMVQSIEPDKIGGYFVCRWLEQSPFAEEIVSAAWNEIRQVTQFVLRLLQDFDEQPWLKDVMPILTEVKLPDTLQIIPKHAFLNNKNITKITIPGTIQTIEYEAFLNCENLVQVKIEDGIKTIGRAAFSNCRLLRIVDIPASIETVEIGAFEHLSREECRFPNGIARDEWFVEAEHPRLFGGFEWKRLSEIVEEIDENGNTTGRRFRLLISKQVIRQCVFDSRSEEDILRRGGRAYSQSAIHTYLLGDFRSRLQDQSGNLPLFITSNDVHKFKTSYYDEHSGEEIWLLTVNDFSKYFPSGNCVTDIANNPSAWWLSTPDENNKRALFVTDEGIVHRAKGRDDHDGLWVSDTCGLRPAFWLIED